MSSSHDVVRVVDRASTDVAEEAFTVRIQLKRHLKGLKEDPRRSEFILSICIGLLFMKIESM